MESVSQLVEDHCWVFEELAAGEQMSRDGDMDVPREARIVSVLSDANNSRLRSARGSTETNPRPSGVPVPVRFQLQLHKQLWGEKPGV